MKVAHGLSWDENYGAGGAFNGPNIAFTASAGKVVAFLYDLETHILTVQASDPPLAGTGQQSAHWIDETTIAWPAELGEAPEDASWQLYASAEAGLAVADGEVTGGDPIELSVIDGGLTADQKADFPALATYVALRVDDQDAAALVKGQLAVAQRDADGLLTGFTGVQLPGVLDDLYAEELDGEGARRLVPGQQADLRACGRPPLRRRRCSPGSLVPPATPSATRPRGTRHPAPGPSPASRR